jgi:putative phosphoribosyl transferase
MFLRSGRSFSASRPRHPDCTREGRRTTTRSFGEIASRFATLHRPGERDVMSDEQVGHTPTLPRIEPVGREPPAFRNRSEAGKFLAQMLTGYAGRSDVIVLGLPRGGVPVAFEVASALSVPLDLFLVRKLGLPGHEELAMGAIASGGVRVLNREVVDALQIPESDVAAATSAEQEELERRQRLYRDDLPPVDVAGKTVILVDDGLATGSSAQAAVLALRQRHPAKVIVAVPVGAAETCARLSEVADRVICAFTPDPFYAVGLWYADFEQTSDQQVHDLLVAAANRGTSFALYP